MYRNCGKRIVDFLLALAGLLLLLPLFLLLFILVRWKLGTPALFAQERPGRDGRIFRILKFRSMTDERGPDGQLLPDADRLTPFGSFLRSTSLDELPELWNVLRGEMSLVGPRPLHVHYLPLYSAEQARRHEVRPGITGWAQVNGRNALSWEQKFAADVWYVDHLSPGLDLKILAMTIVQVFRRDGIEAEGHATMPPFTGNPSGKTDAGE